MRTLNIIGVHVFLEKRKTRILAGKLTKENNHFIFRYEDIYFKEKHVIPLGPEFPLTQQQFTSRSLFPSLRDRIPSVQNPAYPEYCQAMGIDPGEKDPFILLSTIGRRGPSSFIFYPLYDRTISPMEVTKFRELLGLTTREFSTVFEFSQSSLNAFERNRITGSEMLKRLEMIIIFPVVAIHLLKINGGHLIHEKWMHAMKELKNL